MRHVFSFGRHLSPRRPALGHNPHLVEQVRLLRREGADAGLDDEVDVGRFLSRQESRDHQRQPGGQGFRDGAGAGLGNDEVARPHQLGHVIHKAQHKHGGGGFELGEPTPQLLVAPAHNHQLPRMRFLRKVADLRREVADARCAAYHEHGESMLVEPEPPAQGLLLPWRRGPEPEIDGQAEQFHAVGGHTPAQRNLSRTLGRRDDQVGLAEGPSPVEVDEVGDHRHQCAGPATFPDRLMRDVVQKRVDREHHVRVVLPEELEHDPAHARSEHRADGGERGLGVARVVHRAPGRPRPPDDRRVEGREPPHDGGPLPDKRIGDCDDAGWVEQLQRVGQGASRGAMPTTRVAEKNEHARRAAGWGWIEGEGLGYLRRAAPRRAIHRMLYVARRYVMKPIAMIAMLTQRMVRLASSPGDSAPPPGVRFCSIM